MGGRKKPQGQSLSGLHPAVIQVVVKRSYRLR